MQAGETLSFSYLEPNQSRGIQVHECEFELIWPHHKESLIEIYLSIRLSVRPSSIFFATFLFKDCSYMNLKGIPNSEWCTNLVPAWNLWLNAEWNNWRYRQRQSITHSDTANMAFTGNTSSASGWLVTYWNYLVRNTFNCTHKNYFMHLVGLHNTHIIYTAV